MLNDRENKREQARGVLVANLDVLVIALLQHIWTVAVDPVSDEGAVHYVPPEALASNLLSCLHSTCVCACVTEKEKEEEGARRRREGERRRKREGSVTW